MGKKMRATVILLPLILLVVSLLAQGCGGGALAQGSGGPGSIKIQVAYPQDRTAASLKTADGKADRAVAVQCYVIDIFETEDSSLAPVVPTTKVVYPETTATIEEVPVGKKWVLILGYDSSNTVLYKGLSAIEVTPGINTPADITIAPVSPDIPPLPTPTPTPTPPVPPPPGPQPAKLQVASVDNTGAAINADCDPWISVSGDGKYAAFSTTYSIVSADTNINKSDVYIRNLETGVTELVSVDGSGTVGNDSSTYPAVSQDGRYVAFSSLATNLIGSDTNGFEDIFVRDRQTGTTTRASVSTTGVQGNGISYVPCMSPDARYIAFQSSASNLVGSDANGLVDIFVRDMLSNTTTIVSIATDTSQGNNSSTEASISPDGQHVAFYSNATNLVGGDTNGVVDIFMRDILAGTTTRVSMANDGSQANSNSISPSISNNGLFVVFQSDATNLVTGDTNAVTDVFVRDTTANTTTRVSVSTSGSQGNNVSEFPTISSDGRFVVYHSYANNLVAGDANLTADIFMRDRVTNTTALVSKTLDGVAWGDDLSEYPIISPDGRHISYLSKSTNLVSGFTNNFLKMFVLDRGTNLLQP